MITSLLLGICLSISSAGDIDKKECRQSFFTIDSKEEAIEFENYCRENTKETPLELAYAGWSKTRVAEFGVNPFSKWSYFSDGKDEIESAIALDEQNPEIRLIRLSVQMLAPSFLSYDDHIAQDKKMVLRSLNQGWLENDPFYRKQVIDFVIKFGELSSTQVSELKAL